MKDLDSYSPSPFDDRQISLNELAAFTTDHLERMGANNPSGNLDARIAATSAAMTALDDAFTDDQTKLGLRKARKLAKDNFRATLPTEAGKIVSIFEATYGANSPEVLEAVPQGRTVFSNARDDEMENHLDTLLNAVTAHQAELGVTWVTKATDLRDNWMTLYTASEASTGAKTATEDEKAQTRADLQWELYLNLMEIIKLYPRQKEKIGLYMRQDLLENPSGGPAPQPSPDASSSSSPSASSSSSPLPGSSSSSPSASSSSSSPLPSSSSSSSSSP